jgi:hypothetical protein
MLPPRTYQNMSSVEQEVNNYENSEVIESPRISVIVAILAGALKELPDRPTGRINWLSLTAGQRMGPLIFFEGISG